MFVVGNEDRSTTVACGLKPGPVPDKLEGMLGEFEKVFNKAVPGIVWKERKIVEIKGHKWIYLEMTSTAVDTDIHNIMMVTGYKGKMLLFNFNSTKEDFPTMEKVLRQSLETISVK